MPHVTLRAGGRSLGTRSARAAFPVVYDRPVGHYTSNFSIRLQRMSVSDPFSARVAAHWGQLAAKIDEIAERAGVAARDRLTLETTLTALPWPERRRVGLVLEGVRVQAVSEDLRTAVDRMLKLAGDVWANEPPPNEHDTP